MRYLVNLNYSVLADSEKEARRQALKMIQVREVLPGVFSPVDVYNRLEDIRSSDKENFVVLFLDTQNSVVGQETVSVGTLNSSLVHPRELFRTAIAKNCASVIVAHNHPSGSLEPSTEDLAATRRLRDAGRLIGIEVFDHVLVTKFGYKSFRESNLL
jgi:DNA repair protein RadC